MPKALTRKQKTLTEIDLRLYDLMLKFLEAEDITSQEILGYFRVAYTQGYTDCLKEDPKIRGKWIKDLGYGVAGVKL